MSSKRAFSLSPLQIMTLNMTTAIKESNFLSLVTTIFTASSFKKKNNPMLANLANRVAKKCLKKKKKSHSKMKHFWPYQSQKLCKGTDSKPLDNLEMPTMHIFGLGEKTRLPRVNPRTRGEHAISTQTQTGIKH